MTKGPPCRGWCDYGTRNASSNAIGAGTNDPGLTYPAAGDPDGTAVVPCALIPVPFASTDRGQPATARRPAP